MSRIQATVHVHGSPVIVVAGWDNPLKHCFVQIELPEEEVDNPLFDKLVKMELAVMFKPLAEQDVRQALEGAGLALPVAFYEELAQDVANCARNKIVEFDEQGNRRQLI